MDRAKRRKTEWIWAAALAFSLVLHVWFPFSDIYFANSTHSSKGSGKKIAYILSQFEENSSVEVKRNHKPLSVFLSDEFSDFPRQKILCLLGPARRPTASEWDDILKWVDAGGNLVIAAPYRLSETWDLSPIDIQIEKTNHVSVETEGIRTDLVEFGNYIWQSGGKITGANSRNVLLEVAENPQVVRINRLAGKIVICASDWFLSNEAMSASEGDNAVLFHKLLDSVAFSVEAVAFDESLNDTGFPQQVNLLLTGSFRPMTLHFLSLMIMFGWWQCRRFGPLVPPFHARRQNIVDHTDALGSLYYKQRMGSTALRSYLRYVVYDLKLKSHRGRESKIFEAIAQKLNKQPEAINSLMKRAVSLARQKQLDHKSAATMIQRLAQIRKAARKSGIV